MGTKAEAILETIQRLSLPEQQELWHELGRRIAQGPSAEPELYGEPLTELDIEESARVAFAELDKEEGSAGSR